MRGGLIAAAGLTAAIIAAPLALDLIIPEAPRGRIGVYERVTLHDGGATAGIIAPRGWLWLSSRDSGDYLAADRTASISIELHGEVPDPDHLLRTGLPVGALTEPSHSLPATSLPAHQKQPGLAITTLEYDLAAGDSPVLRATVCTTDARPDCLLATGSFSGFVGDPAQDRARTDFLTALAGAEIVR